MFGFQKILSGRLFDINMYKYCNKTFFLMKHNTCYNLHVLGQREMKDQN